MIHRRAGFEWEKNLAQGYLSGNLSPYNSGRWIDVVRFFNCRIKGLDDTPLRRPECKRQIRISWFFYLVLAFTTQFINEKVR